MIKFSWHRGQTSRNRIGPQEFATSTLLLFALGISVTGFAQQAQSVLPLDPISISSPLGEVKVAVDMPVSGQQAPGVSIAKADPVATLRSARMISVRSTSLLVKAPTIEEKLRARHEFNELQLVITRDESEADIILELEHDLLTKYVYTAIDPRTHTVLATGKVSSLGGTVAGKVAKRFLKQVARARK